MTPEALMPTPRVDAEHFVAFTAMDSVMRRLEIEVVHINFARTLEREIAELQRQLAEAQEERDAWASNYRESQVDILSINRTASALREQLAARDVVLRDAQAGIDAASEERYQLLMEWRNEAEKWKKESDMYGWNFFQGMAAGANYVDVLYRRVDRKLKEAKPERPAVAGREAE